MIQYKKVFIKNERLITILMKRKKMTIILKTCRGMSKFYKMRDIFCYYVKLK